MRLGGSICALATPFDARGKIDLDAWRRLVDLHIEASSDGVVVGGSTGESGALEDEELATLLAVATECAQGRMLVIAGCGASSTARALRLTAIAARQGADATLVVTPAYVRPTQAGLVAHYRALADDGGLPLILYNVPSRTGCDLLPETIAQLIDHPRIVAVKEARSEPERMQQLLALRSPSFAVLSGDDPTALRAMQAGADGVISVAANVCPRAFRSLCERAAAGDTAGAGEIDRALHELYEFLGCEPNPIPVKWLLHRQGFMSEVLRLPLLPLTAAWREQAERWVPRIAQLESGISGG